MRSMLAAGVDISQGIIAFKHRCTPSMQLHLVNVQSVSTTLLYFASNYLPVLSHY